MNKYILQFIFKFFRKELGLFENFPPTFNLLDVRVIHYPAVFLFNIAGVGSLKMYKSTLSLLHKGN